MSIVPKGPISSIGQAKAEMARLAAFYKQSASLVEQANTVQAGMAESIEALQAYFTILDGVLGSGIGVQAKPSTKGRSPGVKMAPDRYRSVMPASPATIHERVLVIMKEIGKPVLPKEIAIQYTLRKWQFPKHGTIYNLISGTVAYLYKRKGVLVKGETGYTLKPHKDLSELVNAPQLPLTPEERAKRNKWSKAQYARTRAKRQAEKAAETPALPFLAAEDSPPPQASAQ
jgi:hypothetical protein